MYGVVVGTSLAAQAGGVMASVYAELGDAGQLMGTAQDVGSGINSITGALGDRDIDVFKLYLPAGAFIANVTGPNPTDRPTNDNLFVLFDGNGRGLRADDDSGGLFSPFSPQVTENLAGGFYYLAILPFLAASSPIDSSNLPLWISIQFPANAAPDGPGAANPWAGWSAFGNATAARTYTITLSTSTISAVPIPAALPLFAAGLGAMGLMSRRKKRKAAVAG